jgi:chromosome segregation ATPase
VKITQNPDGAYDDRSVTAADGPACAGCEILRARLAEAERRIDEWRKRWSKAERRVEELEVWRRREQQKRDAGRQRAEKAESELMAAEARAGRAENDSAQMQAERDEARKQRDDEWRVRKEWSERALKAEQGRDALLAAAQRVRDICNAYRESRPTDIQLAMIEEIDAIVYPTPKAK